MQRVRLSVLPGLTLGGLALVALALAGCGLVSASNQTAALAPSTNGPLPANAVKDFTSAQTDQGNGHCDRAIPLYLRAINEAGPYTNAYLSLGNCYVSVGDPTGAIVEYDKAIQIDPTNFGLYITRADAEFGVGSGGQAIADDLTALRLATKQVPSYTTIAQRLNGFGDFADALVAMNMAIAIAPDEPSLYVQRAGIYQSAKENSRAFADYQTAIKIAPYLGLRASIYASLASVYDGTGDFPSAYNAMAKAIALQTSNVIYYLQNGDIHQDGGDLLPALRLYDQAIQHASNVGPNAERAHESKGDVYAKLGQTKNEVAEYTQARRLTTDKAIVARLKAKIKAAQTGQS